MSNPSTVAAGITGGERPAIVPPSRIGLPADPFARVDALREMLSLALSDIKSSTVKNLADRIAADPRPALELEARFTANLLTETVRTAVESGKSCPDIWRDSVLTCLDLLILLRQRDALGRAPSPALDPSQTIRDDGAVARAREVGKDGG